MEDELQHSTKINLSHLPSTTAGTHPYWALQELLSNMLHLFPLTVTTGFWWVFRNLGK